jgi:hypothetical protein
MKRQRSQGGVQFLTGGNGDRKIAQPASAPAERGQQSRNRFSGFGRATTGNRRSADLGAIPEPTVTVRMKENGFEPSPPARLREVRGA